MPELPEVETVVRDLQRRVVGRTITAVWFDWPKLIKDFEAQSRLKVSEKAVAHFRKHIVGKKIERVTRRAKNILIYLSGNHLMLVHQKMTGHFLIGQWRINQKEKRAIPMSPREMIEDSYNHHVHLIFTLDDGRQLGLSDVRKFAKVLFGTRQQIEALPELAHLGPDALDPKLLIGQFLRIVLSENRAIKQVLMDPFVIAGIGNIYSDDILWRAKIHPKRSAKTLKPSEIKALYEAMREVLSTAVRLRGTSTSDFRDTAGKEGGYTGHRLVYQRTGEPCSRCKTSIERVVIGGRSAHFCPKCQRL
jgi:formamidopyrimidine-DNA glycosylase